MKIWCHGISQTDFAKGPNQSAERLSMEITQLMTIVFA